MLHPGPNPPPEILFFSISDRVFFHVQVKYEELKERVNVLGNLLLTPWFGLPSQAALSADVRALSDALTRYMVILKEQQGRNTQRQSTSSLLPASDQSISNVGADFKLRTIEKGYQTSDDYIKLSSDLEHLDYYHSLPLSDYVPNERYLRRHWLEDLIVGHSVIYIVTILEEASQAYISFGVSRSLKPIAHRVLFSVTWPTYSGIYLVISIE